MGSIVVPEEAASHLAAIVLAFNRDVSGHLLDEAEELAALGHGAAAVLIAGTVLEYIERSPGAGLVAPEDRHQLESWRRLRNQAAHGFAVAGSVEEARQVIDGVRRILATGTVSVRAAAGIRGKYAGVRTSSDEFIRRKRDDLELEDRT